MLGQKDTIKLILAMAGMNMTQVAQKMNMTLNNFSAKVNRETFKEEDFEKLAEAVGAKYVRYFEFPDGRTTKAEEEKIEKEKEGNE